MTKENEQEHAQEIALEMADMEREKQKEEAWLKEYKAFKKRLPAIERYRRLCGFKIATDKDWVDPPAVVQE